MLDSFREQGVVFSFFALKYDIVTPNFAAICLFFGTPFSFIEGIFSSESEEKREAILSIRLLSDCLGRSR